MQHRWSLIDLTTRFQLKMENFFCFGCSFTQQTHFGPLKMGFNVQVQSDITINRKIVFFSP